MKRYLTIFKSRLKNRFFMSTLLLGLFVITYGGVQKYTARAQQPILTTEAAQAVVRIRGCYEGVCDYSQGSGAIIHGSGIILTVFHIAVASPDDSESPTYLNDFVIEVLEDVGAPVRPQYRAHLIAVQPEQDLALLRIYGDETGQPIERGRLEDLPSLPISRRNRSLFGAQLHIAGYPKEAGNFIRSTPQNVSGLVNNTDVSIMETLGEGYSGGPALIKRDDGFEIVGVVIERRGSLGQEGVIRNISQLTQLFWRNNKYQVWGDDLQVVAYYEADKAILEIGLQVHTLDYAGRQGHLLAYAFEVEAETHQPLSSTGVQVTQTANNQVVFSREFSATSFVEDQRVVLTAPLDTLPVLPERLSFRVLLWDAAQSRTLWQGEGWFPVQIKDRSVFFPDPKVTASESNINLRQGPGTNHDIVGVLLQGESLKIVGRNSDSSWWQVEAPNGLSWVAAWVTTASNINDDIPVILPPPTPRLPTPSPTPSTPPTPPPPAIAGRIAVPVDNGLGGFDTLIYDLPGGKIIAKLENAHHPNFRPDGVKLLVNGEGNRGNIWRIDTATWTFENAVSSSPTDFHPFYNPEGKRLVVGNANLAVGANGNTNPYIFVQCSLRAPHEEEEERCRNIAHQGILVPNGRIGEIQGSNPVWMGNDLIVYKGCNTWEGGNSCGIFRVGSWANIGGETPAKIPRIDGTDTIPSDAQGDLFLYHDKKNEDWDVYLASWSGGVIRNLSAHAQAADGLGTFSPDGKWVAFVSNRGGPWALWIVPIEGGTPEKLFDIPWPGPLRDWTNERIDWGP